MSIETENEVFNNMFSVYAKDGHNAFCILMPKGRRFWVYEKKSVKEILL